MLRIVYQNVYLGGAETLLLRIGQYFIKMGIPVCIYCEQIISVQMRNEYENAQIRISQSDNSPKAAYDDCQNDDIYLTVTLFCYIECLTIKGENKIKNKLFFYVIHPYNPLHITHSKFINIITKKTYIKIIRQSIICGYMFFMDDMCVRELCKFYNLNIRDVVSIINLPMFISSVDNNRIKEIVSNRKNEFRILTIARSEFPFKGYLKSLIMLFTQLVDIYPTCKLTIISSGKDFQQLKKWVDDANSTIERKIELKKDVPPNQLKYYYEKSSLYIGQGTTLLDACNNAIPALPIEGYTFDLRSKGFFDKVGGCLAVPFGEGESAEQYIYEILDMNDAEYYNLVIRCRRTFENNRIKEIYILCHKYS